MTDTPSTTGPVELGALLVQLREEGLAVTARTLESWRYKRLIPRLQRIDMNGVAVWAYDERSVAHVFTACRLRQQTRDLEVLRVRLWLRGFDQAPEDVRAAIVTCLRRMDATLVRELRAFRGAARESGSTDGETVRGLAASLARKRGASPIPRFVRQSLDDRTKGIEYLLRLSLLSGSDLDASGAKEAEKVLGISRGRRRALRHVEPWLTGAPEGLAAAGDFIGLSSLRTAAETMTADELAEARVVVATLVSGLPLAVQLIGAMTNDPNPAGLGALPGWLSDEAVVILVPWAVLMLRDSPDAVRTIVNALRDMRRQAGPAMVEFLAMSDEDFERRLAARPAAEAARLRRVRRAFSQTDSRRTVQ